jgi:hypothetical protein
MKKHLIKAVIFLINLAVVLVGVILIRNYEKNKNNVENLASDNQIQNPEIEANLSETSANIPDSNQQVNLELVSNDTANQPAMPAANIPSSTAPKASATPTKTVSPAPVSTTSPTTTTSKPKTKTS